jgi:unsaturated rhamnogalacturonyl hydrolase
VQFIENPKINLVQQALLTMQRHSWEQGVAAQVFVEKGQGCESFVIQMAKDYRC